MTDNATPEQATYKLATVDDLKKLKYDSGVAGQLFGSKPAAPINIAAMFILLLLVSGISVLFCTSLMPPKEYWSIISPLLTLALGYIFGKA